jgi:hypothetical protein
MTVATVIVAHTDEERRKHMRLVPIGISRESDGISYLRPEDFSNGRYDGVQLRSDGKKNPVVIMHSKQTDPLRWKVVYGFSQVFFRSFAEAVEFCNSRGFQLVKDQVET